MEGTIIPMSESGTSFAHSERVRDAGFFLVTAFAGVFDLTKASALTVAGQLESGTAGAFGNEATEVLTKLGSKTEGDLAKRGWSLDSAKDLAKNPFTTREALNKETGNLATAYYNKAGDYVVIDNKTGGLVQ